MAPFDPEGRITIGLNAEMSPHEAFYMSRPFVERRPPMALHDHQFYEVFWIDSGSCLHLINGTRSRLSEGDVCFIRPPDCHAFQNDMEPPCRMVNVAFAPETARHMAERYDDFAGRFFWSSGQMPDLVANRPGRLHMLRQLEHALEGGTPTLARVESALLQLMTGILSVEASLPREAPGWVVQACEAMRDPQHLQEGVGALVEMTGKSHAHVSRTFRALFGLSPSGWVNEQRMEQAARQLAETNKPILDVALDCGVEDLSHFYRLFRQRYRTSPAKYRSTTQFDHVHPGTAVEVPNAERPREARR